MKKIIEKLNEELSQGKLPDELNFNKNSEDFIKFDWEKVKYNTFYKDKRYIMRRFPAGHQSIPGFDKIFEMMADDIQSPLEEMLKITDQ